VADASAVAAVVQALVIHLSDRSEAGELGQIADTWRIEENRWSACRHGVDGTMADLLTGARRPTRECLTELLSDLAPVAERLGSSAELARAHELVSANGAIAQRRAAEDGGARAAAEWLAERFSDAPRG
jgi:carboxylate-amine ligase